jgi:hypothetical protein
MIHLFYFCNQESRLPLEKRIALSMKHLSDAQQSTRNYAIFNRSHRH